MNYNFRKATFGEIPKIWSIIQQAILRRKNDGSRQWQDGYPNESVLQSDVEKGTGYVLTEDELIVGYAAVLFNDEPAYHELKGKWLTDGDFVVVHRLAVADSHAGKGLAQKMMLFIEDVGKLNNIFSVKVDTNFDNLPMLRIFEKLGYIYCGEVTFRGGTRKAFEKNLIKI